MKAPCTIAVTALCAMLLGLPPALAQKAPPPKTLYVEFSLPDNDHFSPYPAELTFRAGERYKLVLTNGSRELRHVLMAPEFSHAVKTMAVRKFPGGEEMPLQNFQNGIHVPPGERVEVVLVPFREGRYKFFCQERFHTDAGMEVAVNIVNSRL